VPSTSEKQAKLMAAVAHNPAFAKKVGIPQSVGKEFNKADKGRKFGTGGDNMKSSKKDMSFDEKVEADNKVKEKDAEERATKYRTDAMMEEGKKKGGMIGEYGGAEKYKSKAAKKKHEAKESPSEEKLEAKMGKNMARATMQKVASRAVKSHEKRMHKGMSGGGSVKGYGMARGGRACKMV